MKKINSIFYIIICLGLILSACSNASIKEEQKKAEERVVELFKGEHKKPNTESDGLNFYMPTGVSIDQSKKNNIILKRGKKVYILFYNPNEGRSSEVIYQSTLEPTEKYRVNKTFTDQDGRFGYLLIRDIAEDEYELVVGVGGVKITTQTDADEIAFDAELMIEIASSIEQK
jgi:hypothetical protein